MQNAFQVTGNNANADFTLKLHRGDGMTLIAMNWKNGKPPKDFVGFAIEYKEPKEKRFYALKNRLCFLGSDGSVIPNQLSTLLSPIQKFRWVHFPRNAELKGNFTYRITPVFMNAQDELVYGEPQEAQSLPSSREAPHHHGPATHGVAQFVSRRAAGSRHGGADLHDKRR